jgi:hypothetical protein
MSRAFARLAQVVRVVETGALEIRTPDDDDPALVTALQLDGDIVCSIHTRPLATLVMSGGTLDGLAARHIDAMGRQLGANTGRARLLPHSVAFPVPLGVWGAGGVGFAIAIDVRTYVSTAVIVPLLHWVMRRSLRFALRLAIPVIRQRVVREMKLAE